MWPWRGKREAAPPAGPVVRAEWRRLPPIQRVLAEHPLVNPVQRFSGTLTAWQDPSFLAPLGHRTGPDEPAGLIGDLTVPVPSAAPGADLPVVRTIGPKRSVQRRAVQRAVFAPESPAKPETLTAPGVPDEPTPDASTPDVLTPDAPMPDAPTVGVTGLADPGPAEIGPAGFGAAGIESAGSGRAGIEQVGAASGIPPVIARMTESPAPPKPAPVVGVQPPIAAGPTEMAPAATGPALPPSTTPSSTIPTPSTTPASRPIESTPLTVARQRESASAEPAPNSPAPADSALPPLSVVRIADGGVAQAKPVASTIGGPPPAEPVTISRVGQPTEPSAIDEVPGPDPVAETALPFSRAVGHAPDATAPLPSAANPVADSEEVLPTVGERVGVEAQRPRPGLAAPFVPETLSAGPVGSPRPPSADQTRASRALPAVPAIQRVVAAPQRRLGLGAPISASMPVPGVPANPATSATVDTSPAIEASTTLDNPPAFDIAATLGTTPTSTVQSASDVASVSDVPALPGLASPDVFLTAPVRSLPTLPTAPTPPTEVVESMPDRPLLGSLAPLPKPAEPPTPSAMREPAVQRLPEPAAPAREPATPAVPGHGSPGYRTPGSTAPTLNQVVRLPSISAAPSPGPATLPHLGLAVTAPSPAVRALATPMAPLSLAPVQRAPEMPMAQRIAPAPQTPSLALARPEPIVVTRAIEDEPSTTTTSTNFTSTTTSTTTAPESTPHASTPPSVEPAEKDADKVAQELFGPLLRRIKAELQLDRERRGLLTDLWH
jgi:hypothetical protein